MKKQIILAARLFFTLTSCEKEIILDLENKSGQLVIEGNISNQVGTHVVRITRSVAFTQPNQYPPVANALVTISDNDGLVDTLTYVSDGNYTTTKLRAGVSGKTYTLSVLNEGVTYTAHSEMPALVPLTGLRLVPMTMLGDTVYDVLPEFIDPPSLGNFYAFVVRVANKNGIVFETETDNIGNGIANQRDVDIPDSDENPVRPGDVVFLEMRTIDRNIYIYFNALDRIAGGGPGGGVTPANPPSNISGGALGYFSAHTSQSSTITLK